PHRHAGVPACRPHAADPGRHTPSGIHPAFVPEERRAMAGATTYVKRVRCYFCLDECVQSDIYLKPTLQEGHYTAKTPARSSTKKAPARKAQAKKTSAKRASAPKTAARK